MNINIDLALLFAIEEWRTLKLPLQAFRGGGYGAGLPPHKKIKKLKIYLT